MYVRRRIFALAVFVLLLAGVWWGVSSLVGLVQGALTRPAAAQDSLVVTVASPTSEATPATTPAAAPAQTPTAPPEPVDTHDPSTYDAHGFDPEFRKQLNAAVADAKKMKPKVLVMSGYRSYEKQWRLYKEQIIKTGSEAEASKLVLPPWDSMHVRGRAADVDRVLATWLKLYGRRYGICQRYANEWWHFEMLTTPGGLCPALETTASDGNPEP